MFLGILGLAIQARSQDKFVMAQWSDEQGLPQHSVLAITQTRDGYLWLGTWNGLARFDGVKFENFNLANTPSMRSEEIVSLFEDRRNRLWIGTALGLLRHEHGALSAPAEAQAFIGKRITQIRESADGALWVATDHGIYREREGQFLEVPVPNASWPSESSLLANDATGGLWLTQKTNLFFWKNDQLSWRASFPDAIHSISIHPDGTPWLILRNGTFIRMTKGGPEECHMANGIAKTDLYHTRNGDLWIAANEGVLRVRGEEVLHISKEDGLPGIQVNKVFEDREGTLWLGMSVHGLVRLRPKLFQTYALLDGLGASDAATILEDRQGTLWVGTFGGGGLSRSDNGKWAPAQPAGFPSLMRGVVSLCQTRPGSILIGTYGSGVYQLQDGKAQLHSLSKEFMGSPTRAIFEDREGGLWFGSDRFGVENVQGETVERYDEKRGLSQNTIRAIAQDGVGDIWVGTADGLSRISHGQITCFHAKDGLGVNLINTLFADQAGTLWIGTMGGGLARWKDGRLSRVTSAQGLAQDTVNQIVEDDLGNLWMGSSRGIFQAPKTSLEAVLDAKETSVNCVAYGSADGLLNISCVPGFQPSCAKTTDGRVWFCGSSGVTVIDPKRIQRNVLPPPVHIEKLVLDDKTEIPRRLPTAATLRGNEAELVTIPAGTTRLELHYTGLSLVAPEKVRFRYRLERYDADWRQAGFERVAQYTKVPPGHYRFHVTAANNDGVWNDAGATLALWVQPYYWQTAWFRWVAGLTAAGLVFGLIWPRLSHARRVRVLRLRIAQDLHDEVGSNLGSIQLLTSRVHHQVTQHADPRPLLSEIHDIIAVTGESIRDLVWLVDPEFDTLEQMLAGMESVSARSLMNTHCVIDWNVARKDRALSPEFRSEFFLMFKEILYNIQKHARATRVEITLTQDGEFLVLRVHDNGIGFAGKTGAPGYGLDSLKQRAERLAGTVWIESQPGEGATVIVRVKLT